MYQIIFQSLKEINDFKVLEKGLEFFLHLIEKNSYNAFVFYMLGCMYDCEMLLYRILYSKNHYV